MNWFVICGAALYYAAAVKSGMEHNWAWVGIWLMYGSANLLLAYVEWRGASA